MKNYDKKTPSKYIMYLDANNLYGWTLSQYPRTGKFKWMTEKEIEKINSANQVKDSDKTLILEINLDPNELHEMHNDYPLAEERRTMEKISKGVDLKLVTDETNISKYVSKQTFGSSKIFKQYLVTVHRIKESITMISIIIVLKRSITTKKDYFSPTETA